MTANVFHRVCVLNILVYLLIPTGGATGSESGTEGRSPPLIKNQASDLTPTPDHRIIAYPKQRNKKYTVAHKMDLNSDREKSAGYPVVEAPLNVIGGKWKGIVLYHLLGDVPPKVEYSLTEKGRTRSPILMALREWGAEHIFEEAAIEEKSRLPL